MVQLTSDFERFLSANYPDDYRKVIGEKVDDSLITTILSRYEQKYYIWKKIPNWIKALYHDELPKELYTGHEPYTNFITYLQENYNDYNKIYAPVFTTSNENQDSKSDAITLPKIDAEIFKTIIENPDNTAHCLNILNNGYSTENAIVITYNYNLRKELIEKGLSDTPEGKELWRKSRQNDADAINNEREVNNPEEKALSIIAREIMRAEVIKEYDDAIKELKAKLAKEDNEEKRAKLEKEITTTAAKLEKTKKTHQEEEEKNKKWKEEHPEIVAKIINDIERLQNKGYTCTQAKAMLVSKFKRMRLHPICLTSTTPQLSQIQETKEQPITVDRIEQRAQFLSKDNKNHETLIDRRHKIREESIRPIITAKDEWLKTRKQDIATITYNWKTMQPQKYALHLLKEHFRQQLRESRTITTKSESKEQESSTPNYLEQYNEFANSQPEPLRSALLKTAKAIAEKQSKSSSLTPKSRIASNQLENILQKNMQIS